MRSCRILRSPGSEFDEGTSTEEFVMISRSELDALRSKAEVAPPSRSDADDLPSAREEFADTLKSREAAYSREIAAREQKSAELERAYKAALRDRELATALVGKPLVPGAASQLLKLWRDDFEVIEEDGEIRIVSKDGRGIDQAVSDRLNGADFAHFCLPSSRGGTGARGQNRSASTAPPPASPRTLGESILLKWRESAAPAKGNPSPTGWGRRR